MKVLHLGPESPISSFLKSKGYNVTTHIDRIANPAYLTSFDRVVSYGYRHILKSEHLRAVKAPIVNLHISYLPWNRGADPNYWSWVENTPKGVTIHTIDEGIDTGDILLQREVLFEEDETLTSSYNRLKLEIEALFMENYIAILENTITPTPQPDRGTLHYKKDFPGVSSWETRVSTLKEMTDLEIIDAVEAVRTKNNKNWMDILRIAFKHSPEEARPVLAEINKSDGEISRLLDKLANNG